VVGATVILESFVKSGQAAMARPFASLWRRHTFGSNLINATISLSSKEAFL
jgi:hypothetical protein